jgi:pimeloyl-ACP methyl ester carboxylesterase
MKRNIFIAALLIAPLCVSTAQRKMAAFINGYSPDPNLGWAQSNAPNLSTPAQLVAEGVLTAYVIPTLPSFNPRPQFDQAFSDAFSTNQLNDKWVVVGHSLGGFLARLADAGYPYLRPILDLRGVQLKGVVTIGTPHRGLPAAANVANAVATMNAFNADVLAGPQYYATNGGGPVDEILSFLNNGRPNYQVLASALLDAKADVEGLSQGTMGQVVNQLAPNSDFINALQTIPLNAPHVSISGVESSNSALFRWLSTLGFGSGMTANPDEFDVTYKFSLARLSYQATADAEAIAEGINYWIYWWCLWDCDDERDAYYWHKDAQTAWRRGINSLNAIDDTWFTIHGEYLEATGYYQEWICPGQWESTPDCEGGYWSEPIPYTYYYADQSDGLVTKNRTKWSDNEFFDPNYGGPGAYQYSNVNYDGSGENDGGYNNGEMRDLYRRYGNHGPSKPMQYGKSWIYYWIQQP